MSTNEPVASRMTHLGLLLVAMAMLMQEILLTRIFSVIMWYHFAFAAVSVALFGMTVGALLVYLRPRWFPAESVHQRLSASALVLAATCVACAVVPAMKPIEFPHSVSSVLWLAVIYVAVAVPFVAGGISVCLCLTKFPRQISRLYAADLVGAALGCILLVWTLELVDGPSASVVISVIAALGALAFAWHQCQKRIPTMAISWAVLGMIFIAVNTARGPENSLLRLRWVKGKAEAKPLYERWNSHSRVRVTGSPDRLIRPFGWGFGSNFEPEATARELQLYIDSCAGTVLTAFDGDLEQLGYLEKDLTNLVHHIRPNADVLVVGAGGGRDVLAALRFGQKSIVAVEVNGNIIEALTGHFGDFTGHLDRYPNVEFVNDEARVYIASSDRKFDIVQVSLVDTWAATAAGAFVLAENGLYTVEAWETIFQHLTKRGVLNITRWYLPDAPAPTHRLTVIATRALQRLGINDPRDHILIAAARTDTESPVGTIIVGREPFSEADIQTFNDRVAELGFVPILTPTYALDETFAALADPSRIDAAIAASAFRIDAPTDDRPFFFHTLRASSIFNLSASQTVSGAINNKAVRVLAGLAIVVVTLTGCCILLPLYITTRQDRMPPIGRPLLLYFCAIGVAFMFIEISQMQRLIVFLGRPVYSMSVVLFSLLLGTGIGSFLTDKMKAPARLSDLIRPMGILLGALFVFGASTPGIVRMCADQPTAVRVAVSVTLLLLLGLPMGILFPWAMKLATQRAASLTPWFWGLNGATSACAAVLVVAVSMWSSISTSFWVGTACYVVAIGALSWAVVIRPAPARSVAPRASHDREPLAGPLALN